MPRSTYTLYGLINKVDNELTLTFNADTREQLKDYIQHLLATEDEATSFVFTIIPPTPL